MLYYEMTCDTQMIKSGCVRTTAMHDCMQQRLKSLLSVQNPLICGGFTTEMSLTFEY